MCVCVLRKRELGAPVDCLVWHGPSKKQQMLGSNMTHCIPNDRSTVPGGWGHVASEHLVGLVTKWYTNVLYSPGGSSGAPCLASVAMRSVTARNTLVAIQAWSGALL